METLKNLNKFWRTSALIPATTTPAGTYSDVAASEEDVEVDVELEEEEEEESFFELELEMRNCCRNETTTTNESSRLSSKVVPIEPDLKTHSPISILKSAPKFKVSLFRKPKTELLASSTRSEPEEVNSATRTISTLIRENSSSSSSGLKLEEATLPVDSSKRFSKDVMQKYLKLKLIKPFHIHVAKKSSKSRLFDMRDSNSNSSPASSPAFEKLKPSANGFRVVCNQLGKSRSASSLNVVSVSCGSRRDESLLEHDDGIQSAILHCKRSFNSSRESSMHSRSSSDSTEQEQQPHSEHHHHHLT
ncbi:unnamed protein product [Rhodiola kirilowii]